MRVVKNLKHQVTVESLYLPDGKVLGSLWAGTSGSGKTTAVLSTLQVAISSASFGEKHRFVIIDPKTQAGDYDLLADPLSDLDKVMKSIRKERVTVFWPNIEHIEYEVSQIIDYIFALSDSDLETSFTLIIDEASILITSTKIPTSLKRLAVQGRAKRIKPIFISQRPIINRWTDANVSDLFLFRTMTVDADVLTKRFGVDFESAQNDLREIPYSFLRFDLGEGTIKKLTPVPLPKPKPRKKRSTWKKLKDLI